ncbi:MAG: hypothetical protein HFJ82_04210 [Alistipes sp.]|jgi:hypothetical protein|uniref:hypothetical protein n=1 Tax=uncultured Alistipes sp. TaxID=538949 RepID=UPI00259735B5|nr:hypothetical protein [uncultured Alistipes sp.]MCI9244696.1 hypothetical protein [Alistipes sp.]
MIKKLIGMLFSAAVIAVMVFTVLGRDRYRSMIGNVDFSLPSFMRSQPEAETEPKAKAARNAVAAPTKAAEKSDAEAEPDYLEEDELLTPDLFSSDDY